MSPSGGGMTVRLSYSSGGRLAIMLNSGASDGLTIRLSNSSSAVRLLVMLSDSGGNNRSTTRLLVGMKTTRGSIGLRDSARCGVSVRLSDSSRSARLVVGLSYSSGSRLTVRLSDSSGSRLTGRLSNSSGSRLTAVRLSDSAGNTSCSMSGSGEDTWLHRNSSCTARIGSGSCTSQVWYVILG